MPVAAVSADATRAALGDIAENDCSLKRRHRSIVAEQPAALAIAAVAVDSASPARGSIGCDGAIGERGGGVEANEKSTAPAIAAVRIIAAGAADCRIAGEQSVCDAEFQRAEERIANGEDRPAERIAAVG